MDIKQINVDGKIYDITDEQCRLNINDVDDRFKEHKKFQATELEIGHVKLTHKDDVAIENTYALDAIEKNPNITGTLASQIQASTHSHINKDLLDDLAEYNGELYYKNSKVNDNTGYYNVTDIDTKLDTKVDKESGKDLLDDNDKIEYDKAVKMKHSHPNTDVLNNFSEDSSGNLLYNGANIGGSSFNKTALEVSYDNFSSTLVATDVQSAIDELHTNAIDTNTKVNEVDKKITDATDGVTHDVLTKLSEGTNGQLLYDGNEIGTTFSGKARDVSYDNKTSGLTAINMQTVADELTTKIADNATSISDVDKKVTDATTGIDHDVLTKLSENTSGDLLYDGKIIGSSGGTFSGKASDVSYDNTTSGLTGNNIQAITDEIASKVADNTQKITDAISNVDHDILTKLSDDGSGDLKYDGTSLIDATASKTSFDNSHSGLTATNTQDAIDEIKTAVDTNTTNISTVDKKITDAIDGVDHDVLTKLSESTSGQLMYDGVKVGGNAFSGTATDVTYDNSTSGLVADDVQGAIDELNTHYADLDTRVTSNTTGLTSIDKTVTEYVGKVNDFTTKVTDCEKNVGTLTTSVQTNTTDIADLKTKVADNTANIETNTNNISDLTTKVDDNATDIVNLTKRYTEVDKKITDINNGSVASEKGFANLRYYNDVLQYYDTNTSTWVDISTSTGGIELPDVTNVNIVEASTYSANISWTDPDDIMASGVALAEWDGTLVVRKEGSEPIDKTDGTVVVDSKIRNAYKTNGFEDTNLTRGVEYYYKFFPYTTKKVYTSGTVISINLETIKISNEPVQNGTLTYNGNLQTASFDNFDTSQLSVTGNSGVDAGSYVASFTPKNGYCWSDGTTTAKDIAWTINKADGTVTLSANSLELNKNTLSSTITISNNTGDVSVVSSNTSIATVSILNDTITISSVNDTNGLATITVNVAASQNYNAITETISVNCKFANFTTFADATDEEIAAMLEAHYNGTINIADYWSVGDMRTIHLDAMAATGVGESHVAQDQQFVIIGIEHDDLETPINNHTKAAITVQPLRMLSNGTTFERGYMNSSNTNSGGWEGCARRTWCNSVFVNALPSSIQSLVKTVSKLNYKVYNSTNLTTTSDNAFLLSETEVFGSNKYSVGNTEGTQYEYFKTTSNRRKYQGNATSQGSANYWWERSPNSSATTYFCFVYSDGSAGYYNASYTRGLCPAFCL